MGHLALRFGTRFGGIEADYVKRVIVKSENDCVMKEEKKVRSILVPLRLNEDEKRRLNFLYGKTTCNSLSEYMRSVLLKEPVTILFRNQTADDFLAEMILLKNELNAIGKNFNQVVHKLHTLDHVPEIKAWAILNETGKKSFLKKVEEINQRVHQIYELWSQK